MIVKCCALGHEEPFFRGRGRGFFAQKLYFLLCDKNIWNSLSSNSTFSDFAESTHSSSFMLTQH